jgi:hypothetical protein
VTVLRNLGLGRIGALALLVFLSACGQQVVAPELEPEGSLSISVSVPEGVVASLVVRGPDGYEVHLDGTAVLEGLVAGTYTIAAAPVTFDGVVYDPDPAEFVVELGGDLATSARRVPVALAYAARRGPDPTPMPTPTPPPGDETEPDPDPKPEPEPEPDPDPEPDPTPAPDPDPTPAPEPGPSPTPDPLPLRPGATVYHLDCSAGDDAASGRSPADAWRSLSRLSGLSLAPGDRVLLRRGCTWVGPLRVPWSGSADWPIVVGAYGTGAPPAIRDSHANHVDVSGSHVVIEHLAACTSPGSVWTDPNCAHQPVAWRTGFTLQPSARYVTIQHSLAFGNTAGVHLVRGSRDNRVLHNDLRDNVIMSRNTNDGGWDDSGAWGIVVNGDDNEVAYNRFSGNNAWCSYDFGTEGASIEVYEGSRNFFHHNVSVDDTTFTELGGSASLKPTGNVFAYNQYTSSLPGSQFLIVVGANDHFGPTPGTRAYNNSVYLPHATGTQGVVCHAGCGPDILELRNNVLWVGWKVLYTDAAFAESNNLYWRADGRPLLQFFGTSMNATSRVANPRFVDAAGGDLRLAADSPGIDMGTNWDLRHLTTDLAGVSIPQNGRLDAGAYELPRP